MRRKHNKRRAHGEMGATVTARDFAKTRGSNRAYSKPRRHPQPARHRYSVSDGRESVGIIIPHGPHQWKALDAQGAEVGVFSSLQQAVRALPAQEGRAR